MPAASGSVWVEVDGVRIDGAGVDGAGMCLMESGCMELPGGVWVRFPQLVFRTSLL